MKLILLVFALTFSVHSLTAQDKKSVSVTDTSTATSQYSPVRSLSTEEYESYQNGDEMGMARPAELNNYPSPAKALALAKELKLNDSQKAQLQAAEEALDFKAKEMGRFILQHEKKLNDLFSTGKANEGSVIYYCNQIGLYQGELRNAHLQAHLKARRILTVEQLKKISRVNEKQTKVKMQF
jgi:Spy/CpxP family protein refolding chaperone